MGCPLPRRKCLGVLALSKTKHTGLVFPEYQNSLCHQRLVVHVVGMWPVYVGQRQLPTEKVKPFIDGQISFDFSRVTTHAQLVAS